ncbi:MAG: hypothetical protein WC000_11200, partial [Dokdonella sp.]
ICPYSKDSAHWRFERTGKSWAALEGDTARGRVSSCGLPIPGNFLPSAGVHCGSLAIHGASSIRFSAPAGTDAPGFVAMDFRFAGSGAACMISDYRVIRT